MWKILKKIVTIEDLAKGLHEAARDLVVNHPEQMITAKKGYKFVEWDELTEDQKEGKRLQARYLVENFIIEIEVN